MAPQPSSASSQACPLCGQPALAAAGQVLNLGEVLDRWEREARVSFPPEVRAQYAASEVSLFACGHCAYQVFLPVAAGSPEFYDTVEQGDYYVGDRWEMARAVKDIKARGCGRVLDIGCGSGHFLAQLRAALPRVEALGHELAPEAAQAARDKGFQVHGGDLADLPQSLGEHSLDAVVALQVLEHAPDPLEFLGHLSRLLKPEGIIIIGVPDADGPVNNFTNALTDIPPHHISRWKEATFRQGLGNRGYQVLAIRREPLPHFLWESYLPMMWDSGIWPARLARLSGKPDKPAQVAWFIALMKRLGVKHLWGVPGHTLYAVLQPEAA